MNDICMIIENKKIADDMFQMTVLSPSLTEAARPGQFVHIKIPDDPSLLLRRPISINAACSESGRLELVYQRVGTGTQKLSELKQGRRLDILGPLGNGFDVMNAKNVYLIGGGCGIAPLRYVAQYFHAIKFKTFLGFRNKTAAYQVEEFNQLSEQVFITTNDGSLGNHGLVTEILKEILSQDKPDLILGCGPIPMLKAVKSIAAIHTVPCQVSLEARMGCGIGGCLVCSCAAGTEEAWEYKRVCVDGPVFNSQEVFLDDLSISGC